VNFPPLPQPKLVPDLASTEGYKAELIQVVVISHDSLPAKYDHLSQKQPGSVVAGNRALDHESQFQRLNHFTTKPPLTRATGNTVSDYAFISQIKLLKLFWKLRKQL